MALAPCHADERVTLYRGDALAVLQGLPTASVDAVITDPPYSSGGMVHGAGGSSTDASTKYVGFGNERAGKYPDFPGESRDQRSHGYWSALWLSECLRITRPGGVVLLFTDWRQLPTTTDALQAGGWVWRGIVPWVKPFARPHQGRFKAQAEYVVWGSSGAMGDAPGVGCLPGFYQATPPREREHTTQKPLDVMRSLVQIVRPAGIVLDPFMGAGTTGIAAVIEGRRFIGVELSEHYAAVAAARLTTAARGYRDDGQQLALATDDEVA